MELPGKNKGSESIYFKDSNLVPPPENECHSKLTSGSIGKSDFFIWTLIPLIGIVFCLIHAEQERLWQWTGETPAGAQSFEAKTIVSVISAIIGSCVAAILLKTVKTTSFTLIKYRGAHFSQLATMFGGFSMSNIPMLSAGDGLLPITIIIALVVVSTITKQLAVVSMGVDLVTTPLVTPHYTRNYTTCAPTNTVTEFGRYYSILNFDVLNSIRNQNTTYTNEYYDRSIPEGMEGISNFERVLPFAEASCIPLPPGNRIGPLVPTISAIQSTVYPTMKSAWSSLMLISYREDGSDGDTLLNCTIIIGHATANTSCNNTLCETYRTSEITPYLDTNMGLGDYMVKLFEMTSTLGITKNLLAAWLLGGDITQYHEIGTQIPGESDEVIEERTSILATIIGRVICDRNGGEPYEDVTNFETYSDRREHYIYHVLWKWPFWLIAALILLTWLGCMLTMWITPESRIMSVEWLLSQYIIRNQWGYISGRDLVQVHKGSLFQILDQKADEDIGNIVISKSGVQSDIRNRKILSKKQYQ